MSNVNSFVPLDNRISLAAQSPKNIPSLTQKLNKETINRNRQRMKVTRNVHHGSISILPLGGPTL
jgi:hypothetical protein